MARELCRSGALDQNPEQGNLLLVLPGPPRLPWRGLQQQFCAREMQPQQGSVILPCGCPELVSARPRSGGVPGPAGGWARRRGSYRVLAAGPRSMLWADVGCCPPAGDGYTWRPGFWLANVYLKMLLCINPKYFPPEAKAPCEHNLPVQTEENLYLV